MALLTLDERKAIFAELGLGEYNEKNIKAFQKKYMLRDSDADGKYGTNTDNTLRTVYYTKVYTRNFKPSEFKCECGGKYCCGYPSYMKPAELIHIQAIRDHYGRPVTITSGLRCKTWNKKCGGSIQNSLHMSGLALDFYMQGVTDTLANRKASIKWIKKQPNHHYSYGNGINSYGNGVSAPYMGNALHTDCYDKVQPKHPKLTEKPSTEATSPSAPIVSKAPYTPSTPYTGKLPTEAVKKGDRGANVKRVQRFLNWCINAGLPITGKFGAKTFEATKKYQKQYGVPSTGKFGKKSIARAEKLAAQYAPKPTPTPAPAPDPMQPWFDAMTAQFNWSREQKYAFDDHPTVANSKKKGTCITFPAVSLQRIGLLKEGKYFYFNPKTNKIDGNADSYVKKHPETFELSYPNKKVMTLWKEGKIKVGDIVGYDNPSYHTMVFMGVNKDGKPIFNTMGHKRGLGVTYASYADRKVNMLVHLKKASK